MRWTAIRRNPNSACEGNDFLSKKAVQCLFLSPINGMSECLVCKRKVPNKYAKSIHRICTGQPCKHLDTERLGTNGAKTTVSVTCNSGQYQSVYVVSTCAIHKRCLPTFQPTEEQKEQWGPGQPIDTDIQLYKWCATCPDREPIA